jgi:hypothetical protein
MEREFESRFPLQNFSCRQWLASLQGCTWKRPKLARVAEPDSGAGRVFAARVLFGQQRFESGLGEMPVAGQRFRQAQFPAWVGETSEMCRTSHSSL